ncbi:MAG: hypothetical protein P4L53_14225 [Candidatus Obscuribacterales bacterium]|nr:hypothetical protein [Candidatus Obscuribacterales bacterium]
MDDEEMMTSSSENLAYNPAEESVEELGEDVSTPEGFSKYVQNFDFYELLQISADSSMEIVHRGYLRRVRRLIGSHHLENDTELELWQVESLVQAISLAHEVLRDPHTRSSYDKTRNFKKMVSDGVDLEPARKKAAATKSVHSLLSLIRFSQLVSTSDLEAAMNAAENQTELETASYLVEVGKLTVEELESITLARYLLALGKITMTQYELCISEMQDIGTPMWVNLVAKGWVKMSDVIS